MASAVMSMVDLEPVVSVEYKGIYCSSSTKQLDKRQDMGVHGKYDKGYYIGSFDGHGTSKCINILRTLDYATVALNPLNIREMMIPTDLYNSGSTMNFTTIELNDDIKVTNYNAGDSECMIFVNGDLVFQTVSHTLNRPGERERLAPYLLEQRPVTGAWSPIPISPTRMTVHRSDVSNYKTGESLVPTMALGHNNMTDFKPDVNEFHFKADDHVRVISGSDGFWGMIVKSIDMEVLNTYKLDDLVKFAEMRWKQEWEYVADVKKPDSFETTSFPGYDDITVAIWDNKY